eukprot:jgi/Botrbrau1/20001/Bobra.200_1s0009.1
MRRAVVFLANRVLGRSGSAITVPVPATKLLESAGITIRSTPLAAAQSPFSDRLESRKYWSQGYTLFTGEWSHQEQEFKDYPDIGQAPVICGVHLLAPELAREVLKGKQTRVVLPDFSSVDLMKSPLSEESSRIAAVFSVLEDSEEEVDTPMLPEILCVKRTYQPSNIVRKRRHGYLARVRTKDGRNIINRRRRKGRWRVTA